MHTVKNLYLIDMGAKSLHIYTQRRLSLLLRLKQESLGKYRWQQKHSNKTTLPKPEFHSELYTDFCNHSH